VSATALVVGFAWLGWAVALAAIATLRRRSAVAADAEHELRGAATAIGLAAERLERGGSMAELAPVFRLELSRMEAALTDLRERPPRREADLDAGRLAQVLGNVIDNVAEHGMGPATVRSWRDGRVVRLEVTNRVASSENAGPRRRGRGIAIAERAAKALGGRVRVESEDGVTRAVVELPVDGEAPPDDWPRAA
jgi:signal transduction histidine kinase